MRKFWPLLFLFPLHTLALQTLTVHEDETVLVKLSQASLNRLYVEKDRIARVRGPSGSYSLKNDPDDGSIYLQPLTREAFSLFITTEAGRHFSLWIAPLSTPAETVKLVTPEAGSVQAKAWEASSPYLDLLSTLIRQVMTHQTPDGYGLKAVNAAPTPWHKATLQLIQTYSGDQLAVNVYRLTTGIEPMTLTESPFYRPGVRAIALQETRLAPQQSTLIYEVRDRD